MKKVYTSAKTDIERAASEAVKVIAEATATAAKTIAMAAEAATRVVAANATEAAKVVATQNSGDHDLLQRVDTKVDGLKEAVDKLFSRDEDYVMKEDFNFWRNILVSGMILTIFIGIVTDFIKK